MSTVTILAHGFMQPHKISNGLATIRQRILAADPSADVRTYSWKQFECVPKIAAEIPADARLVMACHSWGAWWCVLLAMQLENRGVPVAALLMADGVNRPPRGTLVIP